MKTPPFPPSSPSDELRKEIREVLVKLAGDAFNAHAFFTLGDNELNQIMLVVARHTKEAVEAAQAEAYEDAKHWLEDRLTSKKDVADICNTRAKVLRGEMEAPKSRFAPTPSPQQSKSKEKNNG